MEVSRNIKNITIIQSSNSTFEDLSKENENTNMKRHMHPIFIPPLFRRAKIWKQLNCQLIDEWIKKMWHIYTMEYYLAIKRNKIELFVVRWMDLESVIQSKVRKRKTNTVC